MGQNIFFLGGRGCAKVTHDGKGQIHPLLWTALKSLSSDPTLIFGICSYIYLIKKFCFLKYCNQKRLIRNLSQKNWSAGDMALEASCVI